MSSAVSVDGLEKAYGEVTAVRGISFSIETGEIFGLLGPNGAGKTTTVEILEGYRTRNAGHVEVLGVDGLASVQNEFSPRFLSSRDELDHCGRLGVAFLPWSPLGGTGRAGEVGDKAHVLAEIGGELGVSPQRVVLAWELSHGDHVVPIPGSSRPETVTDSAQAPHLRLDPAHLERIAADLPDAPRS